MPSNYPQQHELIEEFIRELPADVSFTHRFHENFTNWLPFYWSGFEQTTRYTYLLTKLNPTSSVWDDMRSVCEKHPKSFESRVESY